MTSPRDTFQNLLTPAPPPRPLRSAARTPPSFPSSAWERQRGSSASRADHEPAPAPGREAELPGVRSQAELGNEGGELAHTSTASAAPSISGSNSSSAGPITAGRSRQSATASWVFRPLPV